MDYTQVYKGSCEVSRILHAKLTYLLVYVFKRDTLNVRVNSVVYISV